MLSDIKLDIKLAAESNDAMGIKVGMLEAKMDGMKLAVAKSNDAMGKEVRQLKAKVAGLDAKMDQVLRALRVQPLTSVV